MDKPRVILVTGSRKGIGRYLAEYYAAQGWQVLGCDREPADFTLKNYEHFISDVADEAAVGSLFTAVRKRYNQLDVLINNAGVASMNHSLLTPVTAVNRILSTNVIGTFLFCRESAKLMRKNKFGRIVNFTSVAVPLKLKGESVYAASKAAVISLTQILAYELADFGITVNAVGPAPIQTDLVRSVPRETMDRLIAQQAIRRWGEFRDVSNVIDFFIRPESDFITGQVVYLGGVS